MDQDGYTSEELFHSNSDDDKDVLAHDTCSEESDVDVDMTDLFSFKRKSRGGRSKKDSRDSKSRIITTPLTSKRKTSVTDLEKSSDFQNQAAVLSALKDMSSTLNQLVARVEIQSKR